VSITHFGNRFSTILHIYPHTFDANLRAIEGPLIHVGITSPGEFIFIDF